MAILDEAVSISDLGQRNFWVLWGKSGSGKTKVGSTFPKPMLYLQMGDDGSNTIAQVDGIDAIHIETVAKLKSVLKELIKDRKYKSVFVDTFSMLTNMWTDENIISKKKRMTQQAWGDLKIETEECIRLLHKLARRHNVIASCHEAMETIDGMEDEIIPDACPNVSKGARTYLEGMANYGIHTTKITRTVEKGDEEVEEIKFAAHIGANPYYWTKFQVDSSVKLPAIMVNPTYSKIMKLINGSKA